MAAVVEMKTAESDVGLSTGRSTDRFGLRHSLNKDVVRRILAARYQPKPDSAGPSWLTVLGHAKDSLWSLDGQSSGPPLPPTSDCQPMVSVYFVSYPPEHPRLADDAGGGSQRRI